jgi:hypothetical protein
MATTTSLRSRRSEAQLHALTDVERDIRAADPSARRKYLREFNQRFRSYDSVIDHTEVKQRVASADIVLIGDYHALPASQRYAGTLLEERAHPGDRPVVLAVETIFSRDQHILDEWWRREIDEAELRQRIRFDLDWGYEWGPFYQLLITAREHAEAIYGLDCMPREDLRKIGARDRHAAHKLSEIRRRHPRAVILVLFGESHLAPSHLPKRVREKLPQERVLTVLQNIDALYWRAAGERQESVEAVRIDDHALCVFNSTPLEKYESYRLHLSSLGRAEGEGPDLAPTVYNLIVSLLRVLNVKLYSSHNRTQPVFLVDSLPEIFARGSEARLRRALALENLDEAEAEALLSKVEEHGSAYLPHTNVFYVREFRMMYAAEEAARFVHNTCRSLLSSPGTAIYPSDPEDTFYARALEHALAYLGSRILYPARAQDSAEPDVTRKGLAEQGRAAVRKDAEGREASARQLGYALGADLYRNYLAGTITRSRLRRLFFTSLGEPGKARKLCFELTRKRGPDRKGPRPDHSLLDPQSRIASSR